MNYKKTKISILLLCTIIFLGASYKLSIKKDIEKLMDAMEKPEKALKKLAKGGKFKTSAFKRQFQKLKKSVDKMAKITHKEKEFNEYNQEMLKAINTLQKEIKKKSYSKIKNAWSEVQSTCYSCHDDYREDE